MRAILRTKEIGPCIFKPKDEQWLRDKGMKFQGLRRNNVFASSCVGCLDGLAIEIERPKENAGQFSNRKGFHAICCQGICDAEHRFIFFDCRSPGSTHDSVAISRSKLFNDLCEGLPSPYFVAGDAAYPLIGSLMKPFPGKSRVDIWEDSYNAHLSSLRINIENTFGIFIQRWGIFWRSLRYQPVESTKIIMCCVRLHNFVIDEEGSQRALSMLKTGQEHSAFVYYQDELVDSVGQSRKKGIIGYGPDMRNSMISLLRQFGFLRSHIENK
jgi:hypothetical protein